MTPVQVAARLRQIADRLDASTKPSIELFSADLRTVLAMVQDAGAPARAPGPQGRRMTPSRNSAVDVSNDARFQQERQRVASQKR